MTAAGTRSQNGVFQHVVEVQQDNEGEQDLENFFNALVVDALGDERAEQSAAHTAADHADEIDPLKRGHRAGKERGENAGDLGEDNDIDGVFRGFLGWEKKMMYSEVSAAVLVSMEKKKNRTATLLVPPPMPRKEEMTPKSRPMTMVSTGFLTCLEGRRSLLQT